MALGLVLNRTRQVPAEDSPAFGAIAERFRRAGDLERAVSLCQEGLHRFPNHVSARVTLGWSLLDLGRFDEARAELEKALKRAPDNLAAIRGLAELHDRSEHDEVAALHRAGAKWMAEVSAGAEASSHSHADHAAVEPPEMPQASLAAADPLAAVGELREIHDSLAALKAFSSGTFAEPTAAPVVETPAVATGFAAPTVATPAPVVTANVGTPAVPNAPSSFAAPTAAADPLAAGPWQPVEIETAAAHVLASTPVARVDTTPVQLASPMDMLAVEPEAAPAVPSLDEFDAPMPVPASLAHPASSFDELSSFESLDDLGMDDAFDPPVVATDTVQPIVLTPVIDMPDHGAIAELDSDLPAAGGDWSEMASDAYVLPAAIEAARATADEGPGPWPPVIEDDPVEAPVLAVQSEQVAETAPTAMRKPNVNALNRFLRRVETRRATVMSQYLAG